MDGSHCQHQHLRDTVHHLKSVCWYGVLSRGAHGATQARWKVAQHSMTKLAVPYSELLCQWLDVHVDTVLDIATSSTREISGLRVRSSQCRFLQHVKASCTISRATAVISMFTGSVGTKRRVNLGGSSRGSESREQVLERTRRDRERRKQLKLETSGATTIQVRLFQSLPAKSTK